MEIHRLKPMKPGYDVQLFNDLYQRTASLRKKLIFEIDNRRLGVTKDELSSWFDDKFILVFNKYWDKEPDRLLGYIINSLKTFKFRVLRKAYQGSIYQNMVSLDDADKYINIIPEVEDTAREALINLALSFMEKNLSDDAYFLLQLELTPPPYIAKNLKSLNSPIPVKLILEYLEIPVTVSTQEWIRALREEISQVTKQAKEYFKQVDIATV